MDLNRFYEIFPPGYTFAISHSPKRDEGEWWDRWTWELKPSLRFEGSMYGSEWFGFQTMQEALEDLALFIENNHDLFDTADKGETEEEVILESDFLGHVFVEIDSIDSEGG